MKKVILGLLSCVLFLGFGITAKATDYTKPEMKIFDLKTGKLKKNFLAYDQNFTGGGFVAVGNVSGNSKDEIVTAAGVGGGPHVKIFSKSGKFLNLQFLAFDENFRGGVDVAVGNVLGSKKSRDEIIVSQYTDGKALVRIYGVVKGKIKLYKEFMPFNATGATISSGDVNGDGMDEILVGSGVGSRSLIKIFNGNGVADKLEFYPFEENYRGGVDVAAANVDGGKTFEIAVSKLRFDVAEIKVYKYNNTKRVIGDFNAFGSHDQGANIVAGDVDNDGNDEIIVATNGNSPVIKIFEAYGKKLNQELTPYNSDFRGGTRLAFMKVKTNKKKQTTGEIITMPGKKYYEGRNEYRYIEVSLANQRMYVYHGGKKINEFLVSTGVAKYATPTGDFHVYYKVASQTMRHEYGPDHPDNYNLPDVPNVLAFDGPYTIHGTYWHSNFGYPMSHGCVNLSPADAFWIYHWAEVGESVHVTPW